jgi:hypothetical protein
VTEDFEPVTGDLEAGALRQLDKQRFDRAIVELNDNATRGADEVMMMLVAMVRRTTNVGVATVGAMEAVEQAALDENIERAKDGRPPDACRGRLKFDE